MRNLFQRLLLGLFVALAVAGYALFLALVLLVLIVPGQVLRTLGTIWLNLGTYIQNKLATWGRVLNLKVN